MIIDGQKLVYHDKNISIRKGDNVLSVSVYKNELQSHLFKKYDISTNEGQVIACSELSGILLKYIDDPCDEAIRVALRINHTAITWIKNPSEELKDYAVQNLGAAIKYVEQTEQRQLWAINQNESSYYGILHPTETTNIALLDKNPSKFSSIDKPSQKIIKYAIEKDGMNIVYCSNKDKRKYAELSVRSSKGKSIKYLHGVTTRDLCSLALSYDIENIKFIYHELYEKDALKVVEYDGLLLGQIINPSSKICFAAIKQNGDALKYVTNPFDPMYLETAISTMSDPNLAKTCFDGTKHTHIKLYLKMLFPELE